MPTANYQGQLRESRDIKKCVNGCKTNHIVI